MEQYIIFPLNTISITITNIVFYFIIASLLTVVITAFSGHDKILNHNWGILSESLFRTILNMLDTFVGRQYSIYLPLFYTLFHIILFSNLLGLIPYSSTPTVEIVATLSLAFTLLIGILLMGFLTHKLYLLAIFLPGGTPLVLIPMMVILEIIAYLARTLSLGLRLAINLITGHILAKVIAGFLWLGYIKGANIFILGIGLFLLTLFLSLEVLIAYLQAYIFLFISILTLKDITMH